MLMEKTLSKDTGQKVMRRLDAISAYSEPGPGVTRRPFTEEHRLAATTIQDWMHSAGLSVRIDPAGTIVGRREGPTGSKTLLIGSHQDTIRNGGKYDGIFGIALPIMVLAELKDVVLPYSIEVLAFADEEGVRFPTALMGPRTLAGTFDEADLKSTDKDGIPLAEALAHFGGDPECLSSNLRDASELLGYLEIHIEQGPVLESENRAVGVVTDICGIERWVLETSGQAAHAGTTPMDLRRDAFTGAAEIALEVEQYCRDTDGLVGVIGAVNVEPNVPNAIPGSACFSLELRAAKDVTREEAARSLVETARRIALRRGLTVEATKTYAQKAVPCDPELSDCLAGAISENGAPAFRLMSGATHDASAMSDLCPVAMLFTRCTNGLSHHPDEAITAEDAQTTAECLARFLKLLC